MLLLRNIFISVFVAEVNKISNENYSGYEDKPCKGIGDYGDSRINFISIYFNSG